MSLAILNFLKIKQKQNQGQGLSQVLNFHFFRQLL